MARENLRNQYKPKLNNHRGLLVSLFIFAFILTNTSLAGAATPKSQLDKLVTKAAQSWPKNGAYTMYSNSETKPYLIYYYEEQIVTTVMVPGVSKSWVTVTLAFDPKYNYRKFSNETESAKKILASNNVTSLDWVRFNQGYELYDSTAEFDMVQVKKLLTYPVILAKNALAGAKNVTYNSKKRTYTVSGKCEEKKCLTTISFKANGSFDTIDYQLADGTGWSTVSNLVAPTKPFIDKTRVVDYYTSKIAEY